MIYDNCFNSELCFFSFRFSSVSSLTTQRSLSSTLTLKFYDVYPETNDVVTSKVISILVKLILESD